MTTTKSQTKLTGVIYRTLFKGWRALPQPAREFFYRNRMLNGIKAGTRDLAAKFAGRDDIYNRDYYELVDAMAARSVRPMTESMVREFGPATVADVGCGTGALLAELAARGVEGWGLEYSEAGLEFCRQRKLTVEKFDLTSGVPALPGKHDLVVSTEVAEHVPAEFAGRLVDTITGLADTAVFTAAVPGQGGGTDHVNEQPHAYWIGKFSERGFGFQGETSLRWRAEWQTKGVEACYWRNVMVFTKRQRGGTDIS
jgi:SAM-dependent methyltransferase